MVSQKGQTVKNLIDSNHRPLIIVCSGPSSSIVDYRRIPDDPIIFRMNLFPLEAEYYFGKVVDAMFWSVYREAVQDELYRAILSGDYDIKTFFYSIKLIDKKRKERSDIDKKHVALFTPNYDHWKIMASIPEIARAMMDRPLPTQGLQALATSLVLGFKEIHITGMDFYQSTDKRYSYDIPERIKSKTSPIHFQAGYEKNAHSLKRDLSFFSFLKYLYPDVKIFSLSPQSYLSSLIEVSPIGPHENNFFIKKNKVSDLGPYQIKDEIKSHNHIAKIFTSFIVEFLVLFFKSSFGKKSLNLLNFLRHQINQKIQNV